MSSPYTLYI